MMKYLLFLLFLLLKAGTATAQNKPSLSELTQSSD